MHGKQIFTFLKLVLRILREGHGDEGLCAASFLAVGESRSASEG